MKIRLDLSQLQVFYVLPYIFHKKNNKICKTFKMKWVNFKKKISLRINTIIIITDNQLAPLLSSSHQKLMNMLKNIFGVMNL